MVKNPSILSLNDERAGAGFTLHKIQGYSLRGMLLVNKTVVGR